MKRSDFIKLTLNNPKEGAKILRTQAKKLDKCKRVTDIADEIGKTLFISERTVFRDCKN